MEDSTLQIENFYNGDGSLKIKATCSIGEEHNLVLEFLKNSATVFYGKSGQKKISKHRACEVAEKIINILKKPNVKSGITSDTAYSADIFWDYNGGIRGTWALTTRDMPKKIILEKLPQTHNPIEAQHLEKALEIELYNQTYALYEYVKNFSLEEKS